MPRGGLGAGTAVGLATGAAVGNSELAGAEFTVSAGAGEGRSAAVAAWAVTRPAAGGWPILEMGFNVQPARNASANKQIRPRVNGDAYTMKTILNAQCFHHKDAKTRSGTKKFRVFVTLVPL